jgi:hypothetical protein
VPSKPLDLLRFPAAGQVKTAFKKGTFGRCPDKLPPYKEGKRRKDTMNYPGIYLKIKKKSPAIKG